MLKNRQKNLWLHNLVTFWCKKGAGVTEANSIIINENKHFNNKNIILAK